MGDTRLGYAVVDVETNGVGKSARIIEIGIVLLDEQMRPTHEYETLIDPARDLGPTHVHRITPKMISMAPLFTEVAVAIAKRIEGRILVAHNLSFDQRMLCYEFERLGATFKAGKGICTLKLSGEKLPEACRLHGVKPPQHHRALADARACAGLLQMLGTPRATNAVKIEGVPGGLSPRTHRRCADDGTLNFERLYRRVVYAGRDTRLLQYLDLLDWALDDLTLSVEQQQRLKAMAQELALTQQEVVRCHEQYFRAVVVSAQKDGMITAEEHEAIRCVASALGIPENRVPEVTHPCSGSLEMPVGGVVCFTGSFVDEAGSKLSKSDFADKAKKRGYEVVGSVTKTGCGFVVAVDPSSSSGKAKRARELGKPVIAADQFLRHLQSDHSDLVEVRPSSALSESGPMGFSIQGPPKVVQKRPPHRDRNLFYPQTNLPKDGVVFFGKGALLILGKGKLKSPLVYGTSKPTHGLVDASLIDASLPILKPPAIADERLPYWPNYHDCSPTQRYQYLRWLLNGRRDPDVEIGFVFIYFYGLERRVVADRADLVPIANEVMRLLLIYGESSSFRRYGTTLLWTAIYLAGQAGPVPPKLLSNAIKVTKSWTDETLGLCLGILQSKSFLLPARLAQIVAQQDKRSSSSVIVHRHKAEFKKLFRLKYREKCGHGIELSASKRPKRVDYFPASGSLNRSVRSDDFPAIPSRPEVLSKTAQFKPLLAVWEECVEALRGYSRAKKKSAGEVTTEVYEALPSELREGEHPEQQAWLSTWEANLNDDGWPIVPVSELAGIKQIAQRDRLTKAQSVQLLTTADAIGFGIEPDARITGRNYRWNEKVTLFSYEGDIPEAPANYAAASILLRFGANIAEADGVIDERELQFINEHLQDQFNLTEAESTRLECLQYLLVRSRSGDNKIGKALAKKLPREHRRMVGEFLVGIAAADEHICTAEVKALRRAYRSLDLEESELDRLIEWHAQSTGENVEGASKELHLDIAAVTKIMAETQKVAELLRNAMADEDEDDQTELIDSLGITNPPAEPTSNNHIGSIANDSRTSDSLDQLDARYRPLLESLLTQDEWAPAEARKFADEHGLMLNGAIEAINEWSTDNFGDWLIEEGDSFTIHKQILQETA